jgi:flavodoxin
MKAAVRYFSRSGNTKAVAEAIAKAAETQAVAVDDAGAALAEPVDVLFVGGALYAYGIDSHLREYLDSLDAANVGKAVVFSTSWVSKHAIELIKKSLVNRGITVADEALYFRGRPNDGQLRDADAFARKFL